MLLDTLLSRFTLHIRVEKGLAPSTVAAYGSDLHQFFTFLETKGIEKVETLARSHLLSFIEEQKKSGREDRTIARELSSIRNFLSFAESEGLVPIPFVNEMESFRIPEHFPDHLSLEETLLLLKTSGEKCSAARIRDALITKTLYVLGLRVSELCSLELGQLQLSEGFVRISGKGGKIRLVPIYPEAAKELTEFVNEVRPSFKPLPSERKLFLNNRGKSLSRVSVWKILKQKARDAGLAKNIHPHTLRHSYATHLIQNGADIRTVQELLGHTDVRTTEIYTHLAPEKLREDLKNFHPFYRAN